MTRRTGWVVRFLVACILVGPFTGAALMGNEPDHPTPVVREHVGQTVEVDGLTYTLR